LTDASLFEVISPIKENLSQPLLRLEWMETGVIATTEGNSVSKKLEFEGEGLQNLIQSALAPLHHLRRWGTEKAKETGHSKERQQQSFSGLQSGAPPGEMSTLL
jgi:hypothetical protein